MVGKKFCRIRSVLRLFFIITALPVLAQSDAYRFDAIDIKNGLSNNGVKTIFKDEKGFVWFGTLAGLNRYDGYGFKVFKHQVGDTTSINDDYVNHIVQGPEHTMWVLTPNGWNIFDPRSEKFTARLQSVVGLDPAYENFTNIVQDKGGDFWFVCPGKGLCKYSSATKTVAYYTTASRPLALYSAKVDAITTDHQGFLWVVYKEGVLEKLDPAAGKIVFRTDVLKPYLHPGIFNYRLFADSDNDLWIFNRGEPKGGYFYSTARNTLLPVNRESPSLRLNNNIINEITQDDKGLIWMATDHGGINLIDKKDFSVRYLTNNENDPKSISQNSVTTVYKDNGGIMWIGTFKKGVCQFHESKVKFPLFQHQAGNAGSLVYNDVNKFAEDKEGNLWIGTNGGGLIYFNRKTGAYKQYLHNASDAASLSNNIIVSLLLDSNGKLWIGTYYGGIDCFNGKSFLHYRHDDTNEESLADDRVWEIFKDSRQRFWIGTLSEGLDLFDPKKGTFIHHRPGQPNNSLHTGYVCSILEDRDLNIWVATSNGIDLLDNRSGIFRHMEHIEGDKASLSHNNVIELLQDSRGLVWVATRDGLNVYDPAKKKFRVFRTGDGLPDNSILTVLEDDHHNLWVTTPNGVSNAIVSVANGELQLRFRNFDETDGLQGRQFNENAALKLSNGELVVGGANGFNIFLPSKIAENKTVPRVILTNLQVFNHSIKIGEADNGRVVLPQSITETKELTLRYDQNVFTVEFAALHFLNGDKIKYAYKLKGFNTEWLTTGARDRKATFTNLNPGTYTLLIKAGNEDGVWGAEPYALTIRILPPFWLTTYAFIIYAVLLTGILLLGRRSILRRARAKFDLEQERAEAQRLHELDMMKIKFFTNVSHEFRTPLSLIISPVEKLMKGTEDTGRKSQYQLIHRNARRLLNLVNQLLDFRKMEEQELRLNKTAGDIIHFIKDISASFSDMAENKKIAFSFQSSEDLVLTSFDHDKLERILFNLLSNAFKFTPVGGAVKVLAGLGTGPGKKTVQLKVIDTGIGISREKQDKIFERFFQSDVPGTMVNQGSGIGLAITREFVRMHGGTITVDSDLDRGSCFTVTFPLAPIEVEPDRAGLGDAEAGSEAAPYFPESPADGAAERKKENGKNKTVLLVEDNDDFRFYIKDNLKSAYTIVEARDGKAGWLKALSEHPDLVICDISMPEMNGIELCRKMKGDARTSFIPVILLTALTGEEQQLAGLQTGANDYMTKPFNFEILLSKMNNLLSQQESFKKTYQKQVQARPSDVAGESADQKFIQGVLAVIEKNIANPGFSVEELSRELFMSRVALYKKLFAFTGKTPIEFIRSIRLQRAAQLLLRGDLTVAEVAYEVGFNNPKYFSKYFKMEYNVLPSAYGTIHKTDAQEQSGNRAE